MSPFSDVCPATHAQIPSAATEKGVWSRTQIAEAFSDVQRASRQLCWVPEGQGGFLTITLAKLAAKLKVRLGVGTRYNWPGNL